MSLQPRATARMGLLALALLLGSIDCARADAPPAAPKSATSLPCRNPSAAGLTLPRGFCATVFADHIGHARHLAVSPAGVVYVNTWSGSYYPSNDVLPDGGFLVALKDRHASGKADLVKRFGESVETGGTGGTGIAVGNGYLYAEINDRIVRYALAADEIAPGGAAQTLVSGLPLTGQHPMHPFFIGEDGFLYVDVASATNACQTVNGGLRSRGADPCTELQTRAGLWRYAADKLNQPFSAAERYATGIRNTEGFAVDTTHHRVYITQHGRDELHSMWPDLYDAEQEATLPSEELLLLQAGNDYGWPECYYDPARQSLVLAPEYGGDGGKSLGVCAKKSEPLQAYPAHWAPMAMAIYQGEKFPAHYHEGLFIAFHGSWNRAPYAQEGYNIVFQPMANGSPSASCEIFADGFAGGEKTQARQRTAPRAWRWARMVRCMWPTMWADASTESPTKEMQARAMQRRTTQPAPVSRPRLDRSRRRIPTPSPTLASYLSHREARAKCLRLARRSTAVTWAAPHAPAVMARMRRARPWVPI
jgi:glucose/arabinose dehydrogenase